MKNQDEIKDKVIEYGIDLGTGLILSFLKDKILPKKKQDISTSPVIIQKKPKKKLLRKLALAYILKETVFDRLKANILVKPNTKDYSWLMEYPVGESVIDFRTLINNISENSDVLDLGSGSGYFGIEVSKHIKGKVFCLDNNMEVLKDSKLLAEESVAGNIEFHRANIEKMPFDDNKFDAVFLNMTFGQLKDKIVCLKEIYRILKNTGKLYITEILIDDNYCLSNTVITLANNAGFKAISQTGNFIGYTITFEK